MKEVLDSLRRENSKAVEEANELALAIEEILRAQERVEAGLRELAAEAIVILVLADEATAPRVKHFAGYAAQLSEAHAVHVGAFRELKRGLDGWKTDVKQP